MSNRECFCKFIIIGLEKYCYRKQGQSFLFSERRDLEKILLQRISSESTWLRLKGFQKDIQCYAHRSNNDVHGHEVLPLSAA